MNFTVRKLCNDIFKIVSDTEYHKYCSKNAVNHHPWVKNLWFHLTTNTILWYEGSCGTFVGLEHMLTL